MKIQVRGLNVYVDCAGAAPGAGETGLGPPILFLHGFSGSGVTWRPILELLQEKSPPAMLCPDIVGHGRTDAPETSDRYRMDEAVRDLRALLDHFALSRVDVVGYSMGGRLALHFASAYPERVRRLALESATPGIVDPALRRERIRQDRHLADWIEKHGIEAFVKRWEALPLFASQAKLPEPVREAQRRQRLNNRPHGLANSLRGMGTGAQRPLWRDLERLDVECLIIAGERDEKFAEIGRRMHALFPRSSLFIAVGAGHNVHLERPGLFAGALWAFLSAH